MRILLLLVSVVLLFCDASYGLSRSQTINDKIDVYYDWTRYGKDTDDLITFLNANLDKKYDLIFRKVVTLAGNTVVPTNAITIVAEQGGGVTGNYSVTLNGQEIIASGRVFGDGINVLGYTINEYDDSVWFGSVGDGSTDDTVNLQKLLSFSEKPFIGKTDSHYKITADLTGDTGQNIKSNGAEIRQYTSGENVLSFTSKSDFSVSGLILYATGEIGSIQQNNALFLDTCTDSKVFDTTVKNCGSNGVLLKDCSNVNVYENYILDAPDINYGDAVANDIYVAYSGTGNIVANNQCISGGDIGISVQTIATGDVQINNQIIKNYIGTHKRYGIIAYRTGDPQVTTVNNTIISLNEIYDIEGVTTQNANRPYGAGIYIQGAEHSSVLGNTIDGSNQSTDIEQLSPGAIGLASVSNVSVKGNTIKSPTWYGISIFDPLQLGDGSGTGATFEPEGRVIVEGNKIYSPTKTGIYVKDHNRVSILDNEVYSGATQGLLVRPIAALYSSGLNGIAVRGNSFYGSTLNQAELTTVNDLSFTDNDIFNGSADGVLLTSITGGTIGDNDIVGNTNRGLNLASGSSELEIVGNRVSGNGTGYNPADYYEIHDNRIENNTTDYSGEDAIGLSTYGLVRLLETDATPNVTEGKFFVASGNTTIDWLEGGKRGQEVNIKIRGTDVTFTHDTNYLRLKGATSRVVSQNETIKFIQLFDNLWDEF